MCDVTLRVWGALPGRVAVPQSWMGLRICLLGADGSCEPMVLTRDTLLAILLGLAAVLLPAWLMSSHSRRWFSRPRRAHPPAPARSSSGHGRPRAIHVLREVTSIKGAIIGIDVGGTLAKMVVAEPRAASPMPAEFGEAAGDGMPSGHTHADLVLEIHRRRGGVLSNLVNGAITGAITGASSLGNSIGSS